jgi:protease-4
VQEVYTRILRVKKEKKIPFVALFGDVAASGGYYLGAACDKIVAHPGTITGSIGVIFSVSNMEGLFSKMGYKADPIKSGKHKDIGSPARPLTPEEKLILQSLIDDAYGQFVQAVADGRKMTVEQVKPLADGRIYSGNQAKELGLVDVLGDSLDAAKLAAELGGIKDEKPRVRRDTEKLNDIFELLETRARLTFGMSAAGVTLNAGPSVPRGLLYAWSGGW